MVSPHPRESSMDELRQFFLNLESTFVPPRGTDDQKEQHQDQKLGRMIWESTLAQHHANQPAARRRAREAKEAPPVEPFRFLDLALELRKRVYEYYLVDTASGCRNDLHSRYGNRKMRGPNFYIVGYTGMMGTRPGRRLSITTRTSNYGQKLTQ